MEIIFEKKLTLPVEMNCELFSWVKAREKRRLLPNLCRKIYAMEGKSVKRKLKVGKEKKKRKRCDFFHRFSISYNNLVIF